MKNSMHGLGLQLQHKSERIKELEAEVAHLKIGAQPASKVRDLVLTALKIVDTYIAEGEIEKARQSLKGVIAALGDNFPGDVSYKPAPPKHESGVKPYKPLDHGPRDNEAAAAQYRRQPR